MKAVEERIHSLEIPLADASLLVPSAAVAEVANPSELFPVPGTPPWFLGVVGWRSQAVAVVSFEALMGGAPSFVASGSKVVVFYPLAGRREGEFYALLSSAEPRPQTITSQAIEPEDPARLPDSALIAAGINLKGRTLFIPDFDALRVSFYP